MTKNVPMLLVSAALVLIGAGCEKKAEAPVEDASTPEQAYTQEQRDACTAEAFTISSNIVQAPEGPSNDAYSRVREACLKTVDQPPQYHLIQFTQGPDSDVAEQELREGLDKTFYLLDACKRTGFEWAMYAQKNDHRARYQCRTRCSQGADGGVTCEGTAYESIRYVPLPDQGEDAGSSAPVTGATAPQNAGGTPSNAAPTTTGMNVTGKVTDSLTGQPLPGMTVAVARSSMYATTDIDGRYALQIPFTGDFTIYGADQWYSVTKEVPVAGAGDHVADFVMKPLERAGRTNLVPTARYIRGRTGLHVTVIDDNTRAGIPNVGLLTIQASVPGDENRFTGPKGDFLDEQIPAGSYRFGLLWFDSSARSSYKIDFPNQPNDYLIRVVDGYTTEVRIEVSTE